MSGMCEVKSEKLEMLKQIYTLTQLKILLAVQQGAERMNDIAEAIDSSPSAVRGENGVHFLSAMGFISMTECENPQGGKSGLIIRLAPDGEQFLDAVCGKEEQS